MDTLIVIEFFVILKFFAIRYSYAGFYKKYTLKHWKQYERIPYDVADITYIPTIYTNRVISITEYVWHIGTELILFTYSIQNNVTLI